MSAARRLPVGEGEPALRTDAEGADRVVSCVDREQELSVGSELDLVVRVQVVLGEGWIVERARSAGGDTLELADRSTGPAREHDNLVERLVRHGVERPLRAVRRAGGEREQRRRPEPPKRG